MKYLTIFLLLFPLLLTSETNFQDLRDKINKVPREQKIPFLIELGTAYISSSMDSVVRIYHRAIDLAEQSKNPKLLGDVYHEYGYLFYRKVYLDSSLIYLQKALSYRKAQNDSIEIGIVLNRLGNVYWFLDQQITAKEHYEKALEIQIRFKNDTEIGRCYNNLGSMYRRWGEYQKALNYFLEALDYYQKSNYTEGLAWLNFSVALVYKNINDYPNALKSMKSALDIYSQMPLVNEDSTGIMISYGQLGDIYRLMGDYKEGLYYNLEALRLRKKSGIKTAIADGLIGVGQIYYEIGKYQESIDYLNQSKKLREESKTQSGIDINLKYLGFNYYKLGHVNKALSYLKKGLTVASELNKLDSQKQILEKISQIYEESKNYSLALKYFHQYDAIKDSLSKSEFNKQLTVFKLQTEIKDRKRENEKLALDNKINSLELDKSKAYRNFLYLTIVFFIFVIFVIIYLYKKKIKDHEILKIKNEEINEAHHLLGKEIDERKEIEKQREKLIKELQESLKNVKTLRGLIPICSHCKKIRNDQGYYERLEKYFETHTEAQFSHGLCTECSDKLYGNEDWYKKNNL